MAQVTLKGDPINVGGSFPVEGTQIPDFVLTNNELTDVSKSDFAGSRLVLNVFPSIDTPVCANTVRRFNEEAGNLNNTKVLCISMDLPFAQARFCGAEGLDNVQTLSAFRAPAFGECFGVQIVDSPLKGLFARAVFILDEQGVVKHAQLVPEIAEEPDYETAMKALA